VEPCRRNVEPRMDGRRRGAAGGLRLSGRRPGGGAAPFPAPFRAARPGAAEYVLGFKSPFCPLPLLFPSIYREPSAERAHRGLAPVNINSGGCPCKRAAEGGRGPRRRRCFLRPTRREGAGPDGEFEQPDVPHVPKRLDSAGQRRIESI